MARRPRCATGDPEGGFSLLEMIVVLTIIGLTFLALPGFSRDSRQQAATRASARDLATDLRGARDAAIKENRIVTLRFTRVRQGYLLSGESFRREMRELWDVDLGLADQIGGSGKLRFFPDGSNSGLSAVIGRGRAAYRIRVHWLSGRVSVDG